MSFDQLEFIRHQLNHIHDFKSGLCEVPPIGNEIDFQIAYKAETGGYWNPYWGETTQELPKCLQTIDTIEPKRMVFEHLHRD